MSDSYEMTPFTRIRRLADRGSYDKAVVHAILDEALICHIGLVVEGRPRVIPTLHWRIGSKLYIHGARKAGMFQSLREGAEASVAVTLIDGLVLARSAFHHSANYRSVVAFGRFHELRDPAEQDVALEALLEKLAPGRWEEVRAPSPNELAQTSVMAMDLVEVSAKIRVGPPKDDPEDYDLPVWAGVQPLSLERGKPIPDPTAPPAKGPNSVMGLS